ncbi:hypothetical protein MYBA111488_00630 [Mycobacterium basiliense]
MYELVVAVIESDKHASQRLGHLFRGQTAVFHSFPRGFQEQSVLRIDRGGFLFGDPEELRIELADVVEEGAPLAHRPARHAWLGVVVLVGVPTISGYLGDHVVAPEQRFPQLFWGADTTGQAACHADYRDGRHTWVVHGHITFFFPPASGDLVELSVRAGGCRRTAHRATVPLADSDLYIVE